MRPDLCHGSVWLERTRSRDECAPSQRKTPARHIRLAWVSEKTELSRARPTQASAVDPNVHFLVTQKTAVHLRRFPHAHDRRVRIPVVSIPHGGVARGGVIFETVDDELDGGRGVGGKNEIEVVRVGVEEAQGALPDGVDPMPGQGGGGGSGMRVAVQVGDQVR